MPRKAKPTYETEKEPFPSRLKDLIEERRITQQELADVLGVTRQAVSLYATGQSTPDIKALEKIANYFDVSADYLLGRMETRQPENIEIVKSLGLSDKSIDMIKGCGSPDIKFAGIDVFGKKPYIERPLLDILNLFLESHHSQAFLAAIRIIISPPEAKGKYRNVAPYYAARQYLSQAMECILAEIAQKEGIDLSVYDGLFRKSFEREQQNSNRNKTR